MAVLRLFAAAREAAGTGRDVVDGSTVGEVLDAAVVRYGAEFATILERCKVWRNGDEAARDEPVGEGDEVAVLPPVSGGATGDWCAANDANGSIPAHQTAGRGIGVG